MPAIYGARLKVAMRKTPYKDKIHYRDISQQQQLADDTEYSECCFHAYMIELLTSG